MGFYAELKRRNVFRVGAAYVVVAWLVAQVADLVVDNTGAPDWVMKTLLALLALGLPLALVFAWAFEMTPEGIKREREVDRTQSITGTTGRKLDRAIIVVLVLALGYFAWDKFEMGSGSISATNVAADKASEAAENEPDPISQPSIAVLPFVNMSSDPEQEFFSDGISEEILNVLSRIPNLKVAARTSSFQFKGKNLDVEDIGRQLQVNHVLEGSVRKAGGTLRITAQLIEADHGFHLWSQTFDRKLEDVFVIQDEIANAVADELRTRLAVPSAAPKQHVDMGVYEQYLKGRGLVASRKPESLLEGIDVLGKIAWNAPDYVPARAALARAYVVLPWFSNAMGAGEAREQARYWARQALEQEPDNVEALAVMAIVRIQVDMDPVGALELLQRAVAINPGNITANNFLGDVYTRLGDVDSALRYESRAAELDPLAPVQLTDLANVYMVTGQFGEAIELANRALALDPAFMMAYVHLVDASYCMGDAEKLEAAVERVSALGDTGRSWLDALRFKGLLARGDRAGAEEDLQNRIRQAQAGELDAVFVADDATVLGDFDSAGELLQQALREDDGRWLFPMWTRLPEQAPDSEPWQAFWAQPGPARVAAARRANGFTPKPPCGMGI